jgi:hypothetical protein
VGGEPRFRKDLYEGTAEYYGCVALVWGETPWRRDRPWQRALHDTIERWRDRAGVRDRVRGRWERAIEQAPARDRAPACGAVVRAEEGLFEQDASFAYELARRLRV